MRISWREVFFFCAGYLEVKLLEGEEEEEEEKKEKEKEKKKEKGGSDIKFYTYFNATTFTYTLFNHLISYKSI